MYREIYDFEKKQKKVARAFSKCIVVFIKKSKAAGK